MTVIGIAPFLNLEELLDERTTVTEGEFEDDVTYPRVWRFTARGQRWLIDRYWMLPERVFFGWPDAIRVAQLPEANALWCEQALTELAEHDLRPAIGARFSTTFAGVLTRVNVEVFDAGITMPDGYSGAWAPLALVRAGERLGLLMPKTGGLRAPVPVTPEAVALQKRIDDLGVVRLWQSWELAVALTAEDAG